MLPERRRPRGPAISSPCGVACQPMSAVACEPQAGIPRAAGDSSGRSGTRPKPATRRARRRGTARDCRPAPAPCRRAAACRRDSADRRHAHVLSVAGLPPQFAQDRNRFGQRELFARGRRSVRRESRRALRGAAARARVRASSAASRPRVRAAARIRRRSGAAASTRCVRARRGRSRPTAFRHGRIVRRRVTLHECPAAGVVHPADQRAAAPGAWRMVALRLTAGFNSARMPA